MVVVLDEAANICRIADLPELYSHLGSRGVLPLTILQSYRQGTRACGDHGTDARRPAATREAPGAGVPPPAPRAGPCLGRSCRATAKAPGCGATTAWTRCGRPRPARSSAQ